MTNMDIIKAELQSLQKVLEDKANIYLGPGRTKLLSFANACSGALKLLQEQQPRVLTLEEMKSLSTANDDTLFDRDMTFVWLEAAADGYINITRPTYSFNPEWGNEDDSFYVYYMGTDVGDRLRSCDYGKTWRCWNTRPTDEQRKATPWNEPPKED